MRRRSPTNERPPEPTFFVDENLCVPVFVLVGNATHQQRADVFLRKLKWVRRTIAAHAEPFMARISVVTGNHSLKSLEELMDRYARRLR